MQDNPIDEPALRFTLLEHFRKLDLVGLNRGTSGNLSARLRDGALITPSGLPPDAITSDALVEITMDGRPVGPGVPSSEWRMHCDILAARPEINAVVHTHSPFATTLSTLRRDVPAFHYMIAAAGGDSVRCTGYALFGSRALSALAVTALEHRKACLLGNHGMVAIGRDIAEAVAIAVEVEALCEQYWRALQIGDPVLLTSDEMAAVLDEFRHYGRWKDERAQRL